MFLWVDYDQHLLRKLLENKHSFITLFWRDTDPYMSCNFSLHCKYRSGKSSCWVFLYSEASDSHWSVSPAQSASFCTLTLFASFSILWSHCTKQNKNLKASVNIGPLNSKAHSLVFVDLWCIGLDLKLHPSC